MTKPALETKITAAKVSGKVGVIKIAENKDCKEGGVYKEKIKTVEECGQICAGLSTVITYAKTQGRCNSDGCDCFCTKTTIEGKCEQEDSPNYDIYRVTGELIL